MDGRPLRKRLRIKYFLLESSTKKTYCTVYVTLGNIPLKVVICHHIAIRITGVSGTSNRGMSDSQNIANKLRVSLAG